MSESGERVSVVIPTYYRNEMLADAIESARRQTHQPVEIVVVDDSGTGNAQFVVESYPDVAYVEFDENRGPQAAREAGVRTTTGRYVQFLDDDDMLRPTKLSAQLPLFTDAVGAVYCGYQDAESGTIELPDPTVRGDILERALTLETWPCNTDTLLIERGVLESMLPFEHHHGAEDDGFRIELARRTRFDFVDAPLVVRRKHSPNRRASSWAYVEGRKAVVDSYPDLYAAHPRARRTALRKTYQLAAYRYRQERRWALGMPVSYLRAAVHAESTGIRLRLFASAALSLAGRPALDAGGRLLATIQDGLGRAP